jgi:GH24 family phage-related lysozyme (muramidase)
MNYNLAAKLIAFFEDFEPRAYWDVNHWRVGFGSDTEGPDQVNVTRATATTHERALANLALRIPQYERAILSQLGIQSSHVWGILPDNAKAALLSFAYNYGSLTPSLLMAVKANNLSSISKAIEDREVDNNGVNAKRRFAEAAFVASVE